MKTYNLQQQTPEWHELRHGKIGGTTSEQLHTSGDALLNQMIAERVEPFDPMSSQSFVSDAMQRGIDMEPQARAYMEEYLSTKLEVPGWCQSDELDFMGFSPDGITSDYRTAIEIKCPTAKVHVEYIRLGDQVPQKYTHQLAQMFAVCEQLEAVYFVSYRPEFTAKPAHIVKVTRHTMAPVIAKLEKKHGPMTFGSLAQIKMEEAWDLNDRITLELIKLEG